MSHLQVAWVSKDFVAVFTRKPPVLSVDHLVFQQVWPPSKALGTVLTPELTWLVPM